MSCVDPDPPRSHFRRIYFLFTIHKNKLLFTKKTQKPHSLPLIRLLWKGCFSRSSHNQVTRCHFFYPAWLPHSDCLGLQQEAMRWAGLSCCFIFAEVVMRSNVSDIGELFLSLPTHPPPQIVLFRGQKLRTNVEAALEQGECVQTHTRLCVHTYTCLAHTHTHTRQCSMHCWSTHVGKKFCHLEKKKMHVLWLQWFSIAFPLRAV